MTFKSGYICSACAKEHKCKWPPGHVATCHAGECDFCGEYASLCHSTDWNWPGKRMRPEEREY